MLAVDPFGVIILGGTALFLVVLILLGLYHPRSGADALRWRPTQSAEVQAENELNDLSEMLDAANERRRSRGKAERSLGDVERSVIEHQEEQERRRQEGPEAKAEADREIAELLELKNARRARRGLPPLTREEYEAQLRRS